LPNLLTFFHLTIDVKTSEFLKNPEAYLLSHRGDLNS
jgi:hypothetical protein